jgi:hypothetical protein
VQKTGVGDDRAHVEPVRQGPSRSKKCQWFGWSVRLSPRAGGGPKEMVTNEDPGDAQRLPLLDLLTESVDGSTLETAVNGKHSLATAPCSTEYRMTFSLPRRLVR